MSDSHEKILYAYDIVGKARWAHLITSHHIKPEPLGWWRVLRSAHLAYQRCSMHFLVRISFWNGKIKLSSKAKMRECQMGWSHHTFRSETNSMTARNTTSLGTTRWWAHLRTRHHIKPSPKGSGLMWWLVLRWAHHPMQRCQQTAHWLNVASMLGQCMRNWPNIKYTLVQPSANKDVKFNMYLFVTEYKSSDT